MNSPARALRLTPHLAIASVGYVLFAYAAVPEAMMAAYDIGFTEVGLLMSAALAAFVLVQVPAGRLTSKHTSTRLLLYGTAAHVLLTVALDLASSFTALLVLRALWGLAGGFILSVGATHVARLYSGQAATRQQGVYGGMVTLGGAVGFAMAPRLVEMGMLYAPGALVALPALAILVRERHDVSTAPSREASRSSLATAFSLTVALTSLCYVAIIASYITLSTFITAYAADFDIVGPLNVAVLVTATGARISGGIASVRLSVSDSWFIAGATALAAASFAGLAVFDTPSVTFLLPVVAMLAVSAPFGAVYAVTADATLHEGAALAIVVAAGNLAALVLPAITGALRDATGTYTSGFALLAALNVVALGAAALLGTKQISQVQYP